MPKIIPKIILKNQLLIAIRTVSFNLLNTVIKILILIFGMNAESRNSEIKLIPPKCILLIKLIQIGMKINIGRKDKLVGFNFNLYNYLINFF